MCQNMSLHIIILVSVLASGGETRSHDKLPGSPQDGAAVGLDLYNEKCLDSKTIGCNNNSVEPSATAQPTTDSTADITGQPYTSVKPSATTQPTNDSTADITGQPYTSAKLSATTQPTTDSTADSTGQPYTSVKPSATTQPTTDSTTDSTGQPYTSAKPFATIQPTPANTYSGLYLYEASTRGDLASVNKALTAAGTNLNWGNPDKQSATPLHAAAQFNHADVVTALLDAGADKDRQDDSGQTPLYYASRNGSIDAVNELIAHGASVDIQDNYLKLTALHMAAMSNHPDIVTALLDAGAKINHQDVHGWTPLTYGTYASIRGSYDALSVLIARGTDVNAPNNAGTTPVAAASSLGHLHVVEILVAANADVNIPNDYGFTALHQATQGSQNRHNRLDIAKVLLHNGADVSKQDNRGRTPAALAQEKGLQEMVDIFNSFTRTTDK